MRRAWSGDGKRLLYLSNGKLRIVASDGATPPTTVPLDLAWHREAAGKKILVHAGTLWDGLGPNVRIECGLDHRWQTDPEDRTASR